MTAYPEKDDKEIRLFGDKSIREEAYRKKILQLEKEVSKLESFAKGQNSIANSGRDHEPKNLNNLYHDSLLSFDVRIKREQELLQKRVTEITQSLDAQSHKALVDIERLYKKQILFLSVLAGTMALLLALCLFGIRQYALFMPYGAENTKGFYSRADRIRKALSTDSRYHNHYSVDNIVFVDNIFVIDISFYGVLNDDWFLSAVARDIARVFSRVSGKSAGEINFRHNDKIVAKANIPGGNSKVFIGYYR
ncbi:MAG: hypothetical protein WC487_00075 [Candidatus Omnitrophota bacterium]